MTEKKKNTDFRILDRPDIKPRRYAAGETIIAKGAMTREMFLVRKGKVEIVLHGKAVDAVGPGGIFGEMSLIDMEPRSATAVAVEDCEVVPIDERLFVELVQESPYFALDVMRVLAERIRMLDRLV
jgi:CRP/FNR family cyclic AMP-dependent transcriptional regulator